MAGGKNVIRRDVVQLGFEVEDSPYGELQRDMDRLHSEVAGVSRATENAANDASSMGNSFRSAANEASSAANGLNESLRRTQRNADGLRDNGVEDLGEDLEGASEEAENAESSTSNLTGSIGQLAGALNIVAATAAFAYVANSAAEAEQAVNKLQSATGASAEEMQEYEKSMRSLYVNGMGESLMEVSDVMALVKQQFKDLDSGTIERITNDALVLRDTFDMDINETLRGTNALMTNMGLSATEAYDLIAKGAQNGLDKSGELTDNIAEYSQLWAQAGFSAEEMFTILQNGLDSGAYNLDKVNDFVKEFTISLSDGRIEKNIDSFSERTQELFSKWQDGSASQKDVFNSIISDLGSMKSEQEALTVASTVWSALGEDNAMKVITSLNKTNDTYKNVEGTMKSINDIRYDDIGTSIQNLSRSFDTMLNQTLAPAMSGLSEMLSIGLNYVTDFAKENQALASGIGTAVVAAAALTIGLVAVSGAISLVTTAATALGVATGGVLPVVGAVIASVAALAGIIAAAFTSSEDEIEDYNGTLEECRLEAEATAAAHKKAVERYGENSKAAKDLEKNLDKLNAQYEKGGGYLGELNQKIEDTTESLDELSTANKNTMKSIEDSQIQGMQAVSMLEALSSKAEITSSDLDMMGKYADYLNNTFHTNIVVNYDTGDLTGFDPTAVTQGIIDAANDSRVEQAMSYLTGAEFTSGYIEAAKNLNDARIELSNQQKEFDAVSAEMESRAGFAGHMGDTAKRYKELKGSIEDTQKTVEDAESAFAEYDAQLEENGNIIDATGKTTELYRDSMKQAAKDGKNFISMVEESAEAGDDAAQGLAGAQEAVSKYNDELYDLATAYDEALASAQESVAGQYAVWEDVGDLAQTSVSDIQGALQSQSEYWASYSDNLAILQEKAQGIEGLSDMIATMADGSEDSAAAIAALAGASDADLSTVVQNWQSVKDKQDIASKSMADTATQFNKKVAEMGADMEGLVKDMDMSKTAQTNAGKTINSFIDTMITTINNRKSEVTTALEGLMSAANQYNITVNTPVQQNAEGTTDSDDVFIAGERGAELVVGKKGSTVFPASETSKIISAVQDYAGGYKPSGATSKTVHNNTTYAPQFTLNMNGSSANNETKRTIMKWIKESMNEVFDNLARDNPAVVEV